MTQAVSMPAGSLILAQDLDAYENLTGTWTEYAPTWTASSVNPAIGDGTLTAHYMQAGHFVVYKGAIVIGSTTTFGSGYWIISIPVSMSLSNRNTGIATLNDVSTSINDRAGALDLLNATTFRIVANGRVDATTPFIWAAGDALRWLYIGEA